MIKEITQEQVADHTGSLNMAALQRQLHQMREVLNELRQRVPFLNGNEVTVSFTATTQKRIKHGLTREYQGWFPIRNPGGVLTEDSSNNTRKSSELWLTSDIDAEVTLWIF